MGAYGIPEADLVRASVKLQNWAEEATNCKARPVFAALIGLDGEVLSKAANGERFVVCDKHDHATGRCSCLHAEMALLIPNESILQGSISLQRSRSAFLDGRATLVTTLSPCTHCAHFVSKWYKANYGTPRTSARWLKTYLKDSRGPDVLIRHGFDAALLPGDFNVR